MSVRPMRADELASVQALHAKLLPDEPTAHQRLSFDLSERLQLFHKKL
jgi:hypothetical protein